MSLIGTYRGLVRRTVHLPIWLHIFMDFLKHRANLFESRSTWSGYVRSVVRDYRNGRHYHRLEKEYQRIQTWTYERVPVVSWLPVARNPSPPYLCPQCGADENHLGPHTLQFETVRFRSPGPWRKFSWLQRLVLYCAACGQDSGGEDYLVRTRIVFPHSPQVNPRRAGKRVYHLSYDVSYGPAYSRNRRQVRERGTHNLMECRAEVVSLEEDAPTPDLSAQYIVHVTVDDYVLPPTHPLFPAVMKALTEYERERMEREVTRG